MSCSASGAAAGSPEPPTDAQVGEVELVLAAVEAAAADRARVAARLAGGDRRQLRRDRDALHRALAAGVAQLAAQPRDPLAQRGGGVAAQRATCRPAGALARARARPGARAAWRRGSAARCSASRRAARIWPATVRWPATGARSAARSGDGGSSASAALPAAGQREQRGGGTGGLYGAQARATVGGRHRDLVSRPRRRHGGRRRARSGATAGDGGTGKGRRRPTR